MTSKSIKNVPEICRTCLKQVYVPSQLIYLHWMEPNLELSYQQKLKSCISEIDLSITPKAIICNECLAAVDLISTFKKTCLQTEQRILSYLRENASTSYVDLLQVVQWNANNKHVKTAGKSKPGPDLTFPAVVEQEHCYARKGDGEVNSRQEQGNEQLDVNNWSMLDVANNITIEGGNSPEKIQVSEIHTQAHAITVKKVSKGSTTPRKRATNIRPNRCQFCTYGAPDANKLALHVQKKHSKDGLKQKEEPSKNRPRRKCTLCTFTCVSKTMLNDHTKMHTGERHYKCNVCTYRCNFKSNLQNHMRIHTGKPNPFHCNMCNFSTPSRANLSVHVRTHTGEKPYKCKDCSFRCNNKNRLKFHKIVKHTEETPFKCHLCNYSAKLKSYLVAHMRTHSGEKPYKCSECDFTCATKYSLVGHHKRIHTVDKSYKCDSCEYKCTNKRALRFHRNVHLDVNLFKCPECEYCSCWRSSVKSHMRSHERDSVFKCTDCEYNCSQYHRLVVHRRTHAKEKPFKCTQCRFRCADQHTLDNHIEAHPEKPHKCKECHYSTYWKNCLNVHQRTHTGEKPYTCVACPYKCSTQSKLTVHMRIHRGVKCYRCKRCEFRCKDSNDFKIHMRHHVGRLVRMEFYRKMVPYKPTP